MMKNFKNVLLIAITLCHLFMSSAEATTTTPSTEIANLESKAGPIRDLTIIYWLGRGTPQCPEQSAAYTTTFKSALLSRFPAMFKANGIPVIEALVAPTPLRYQRTESGDLTLPFLKNIKTSHALVLIEEEFSSNGSKCDPDLQINVTFDTRLWDIANNRQLYVDGEILHLLIKKPLQCSEELARATLYHLSRDKIINIKNNKPIYLDEQIAASPSMQVDKQ